MPTFYETLATTFEEKLTSAKVGLHPNLLLTEMWGQERVKKLAFGDGASRSGQLVRRIRDSAVTLVLLVHGPIALPDSPRNDFGVQRAPQGQPAR